MNDGAPNQVIEFLGKSFACEDAAAVASDSSAKDVIVKASPGLVMRWRGLDPSILQGGDAVYDSSRDVDSGPTASIELDGCDYPILRASVRSGRVGDSVVVEVEGTAETVEYDGCDEVVKSVPFRAVFAIPATPI